MLVEPSAYRLGKLASSLDNYFRITERGSSFATEFSGGMTTFFAMCYILVLNGIIIAGPFNTGIPVRGTFFATALASGEKGSLHVAPGAALGCLTSLLARSKYHRCVSYLLQICGG